MKRYHFATIDSTNNEARRLIQNGEANALPLVITASKQTGGRGRLGRSFYSPEDTGIYLSIVTEFPDIPPEAVAITARISVAVAEAIEEVAGIRAGIKWVNDIYIDGKKICGILTETVPNQDRRLAIIGIGINVTTTFFPEELRDVAGSLGEAACGRKELLQETVIRNVLQIAAGRRPYIDAYRARSVVLGRAVLYEYAGVRKRGTAVDIDDSGALLISCEDGSRDLLQSGEISLRLL